MGPIFLEKKSFSSPLPVSLAIEAVLSHRVVHISLKHRDLQPGWTKSKLEITNPALRGQPPAGPVGIRWC